MTWDEGLRYVAAERSQRKMKEDAVLNAPAVQFPPKIPGPHNTRMSGLSKSFDEFLSSHDTSGTPVEEEGSGSYVTAKRSISSGSPTFEEWIANSKNLNIYELSNTAEKNSFEGDFKIRTVGSTSDSGRTDECVHAWCCDLHCHRIALSEFASVSLQSTIPFRDVLLFPHLKMETHFRLPRTFKKKRSHRS